MLLFWCFVAILFLFVELFTITFGFVFMSIGAVVIVALLNAHLLNDADLLYQFLLFLAFGVVGFICFYRSFKHSQRQSQQLYKEDTTAEVILADIHKGQEGKVKYCGSIFNAQIDATSDVEMLPQGSRVTITEFQGNCAIITKFTE